MAPAASRPGTGPSERRWPASPWARWGNLVGATPWPKGLRPLWAEDWTSKPTRDSVSYRPFEDRDLPQVAELFRRQWCGQLEPRMGELASQATVCNYLADAGWGVVAERASQVLGVALVACGPRDSEARSAWLARRDELLAQVGPGARFGVEIGPVEAEEGRLSARYARDAEACDAERAFAAAEIKLLIVSPATCVTRAALAFSSSRTTPATWASTTTWTFLGVSRSRRRRSRASVYTPTGGSWLGASRPAQRATSPLGRPNHVGPFADGPAVASRPSSTLLPIEWFSHVRGQGAGHVRHTEGDTS